MMAQPVDMVFDDQEIVKLYREYRPTPPENLISTVVDFVKEKSVEPLQLCVDVGCGSGQNTNMFTNYFQQVIGVDVSQEQVQLATKNCTHHNVIFKEGIAERLPVEDESAELVTSSVAIHWFNLDKFYKEVTRVLKPGGVLACYSYLGCTPIYAGKSYASTILEIGGMLNNYFPEEHKHLWTEYGTLPAFSPEEQMFSARDEKFTVETDSTLDDFLGYISSWSAFIKLRDIEGEAAASRFISESKQKLTDVMGIPDERVVLRRRYKYFLRMWRNPAA